MRGFMSRITSCGVQARWADEAIAAMAPDNPPDAELMAVFEALVDSQTAVMTVRGPVRRDFLHSRGLSRI